MNNEEFRRLVLANSAKPSGGGDGTSPAQKASSGQTIFGSRNRASIPMASRRAAPGTQLGFARQAVERNRGAASKRQSRTSAPKGSTLATGYVDRAQERRQQGSDDKLARIRTLEESLERKEIDQKTFDRQLNEIAAGDVSTTHLVKGLDFKLLERAQREEDVYDEAPDSGQSRLEEPGGVADAADDEELDKLGAQDIKAIVREKTEKKGQLSTVSLVPGKKRTRNQILAELRAARAVTKHQTEPTLGARFKRIGEKKEPGRRIERDHKGREVLVEVDEDGHEKRTVRRKGVEEESAREEFKPDKSAKPLGMEVPEAYRRKQEPEEEESSDIFEGVAEYDPWAGLRRDSDDDPESSTDSDAEHEAKDVGKKTSRLASARDSMKLGDDELLPPPPPPLPSPPPPPKQDYFKGAKTSLISAEANKSSSLNNSAILSAIKKAASLKPRDRRPGGEDEPDNNDNDEDDDDDDDDDDERVRRYAEPDELEDGEAQRRRERHRQMLQASDRDLEDMDMGFGTSRLGDGDDDLEDGRRTKLSKWGGAGHDDDRNDERGGDGKGVKRRKRGPKKKKGDANNAADVMRLVEERSKS